MIRSLAAGLLAATLLPLGTAASAAPAPHVEKPAACHHLASSVGITATTITLGNASDISGPVPGLEESVQDATTAFVIYFNRSHSICGRKLSLHTYDSKTDAGADQVAYTSACHDTFATVGSDSAFDSGGAAVAQQCGLPDVRVTSNSSDRRACTTCFALHPQNARRFPRAIGALIKHHYRGAGHAGLLYLDTPTATERGTVAAKVESHQGIHFGVVAVIATTEFNYAPYVQQLKDAHVTTVQFLTGGQLEPIEKLAQTMQMLNYHPKVLLLDTTAYTPDYTDHGIPTVVYLDTQPFETTKPSRELRLYLHSLHASNPSAVPTVDGLYAWSAARLFVEQAEDLSSGLTRASLVRRLRKVTQWRDHDLHAPQHVGSGAVNGCYRFVRHSAGTWVPLAGRKLHCGGVGSI